MKKLRVFADNKGYRTCSNELTVHPALKEYFGYCLKKAAIRHTFMMSEALPDGMVPPQFGILLVLRASEPLNQISLGESMGIDKATMVKLIDGLEKQGLVERLANQADRRVKRVKITAKGELFAEKKLKHSQQITEKFLSRLTPEERKVLREALPKLLAD